MSENKSGNRFEIHYFAIRGRDGPLRILFNAHGVKYTSSTGIENWPKMKEEGIKSGAVPIGTLPVLTDHEKKFSVGNSAAMVIYAGKELGAGGKDAVEEAKILQFVFSLYDTREALLGGMFTESGYSEDVAAKLGKNLDVLEALVSGDHVVGDKFSAADAFFVDLVSTVSQIDESEISKRKNISALFNSLVKTGTVAKYLKEGDGLGLYPPFAKKLEEAHARLKQKK